MIENTFCHISGIGEKTEARLWDLGIFSWQDFFQTPDPPIGRAKTALVQSELAQSVKSLNDGNFDYFSDRLPSCQHWRMFAPFAGRVAYIDIETNGLSRDYDLITTIALYDGRQIRWYVHGQNLDRFPAQVATGAKKDEIKQFTIEPGEGIAGHVAKTGEPLLIGDVNLDKRWCRSISDQLGFKTKSIACVPLKIGGNVIGVVEFINKGDSGAFQETDLELISVFADLTGIAIENARKFKLVENEPVDAGKTFNGPPGRGILSPWGKHPHFSRCSCHCSHKQENP